MTHFYLTAVVLKFFFQKLNFPENQIRNWYVVKSLKYLLNMFINVKFKNYFLDFLLSFKIYIHWFCTNYTISDNNHFQ